MKNRIIEICELGQPQSIIHRENEPITELIKTEVLIKELNEAINYMHSRESDSELLKDKPKLNFENWYITYGYAKSVTGNFVKEGIRYTADEMQFKYEYNMP